MSYRDLRVIKTYEILYNSLFNLLRHNDFKRIRVHDLCQQAKISRATFYVHFLDKFDFLKHCLKTIELDIVNCNTEDIEKSNRFLSDNKAIIKNLFYDAENETLKILFEFIESVLKIKNDNAENNSEYIVFSHILVGGIISYINWQIDNKFPHELKIINNHLLGIVNMFKERQR